MGGKTGVDVDFKGVVSRAARTAPDYAAVLLRRFPSNSS